MFKGYDFTFAGMPASMFGLYISDIGSKRHSENSFGNKANIVETRLANRVTPIHYGVRYNDTPLSFNLIFGADRELDRYEMQEVSMWLTGYQDYQWLCIHQDDLEHVLFRCLITELTPIHVSWIPVAFEAKVQCDCPYGYSYPFEETFAIDGETRVRFFNESTCRELLRPMMKISLNEGCSEFSAQNTATGEDAMKFTGLPSGGLQITIDNENLVLTDEAGEYNLYNYFNFRFMEMAPGENELVFNGQGTVTFSGRYLYNVGA